MVELAKSLALIGHTASIVAPLYVNRYLKENDSVLSAGHYLPVFPRFTGRILRSVSSILARISLFHSDFDVYHSSYYSNIDRLPSPHPRVVTVYDLIHELGIAGQGPQIATQISHKRLALQQADIVLTISEATRRDLLDFYSISPSRVFVTPLGTTGPKTILSPAGEVLPGAQILYVGRRESYKNFGLLLEAFSRLPQSHGTSKLVAFGGGPFSREELKQMSDLRIDANRVSWVAGDDEALSRHYRDSAFLVCTSLYEGFGLPIIEAFANGCAVLTSDRGSLGEVAGDAARYFDPDSVESLLEEMTFLLTNRTEVERLRSLGLQRAKEFTWQECASKTVAAYSSLSSAG